MPTNRIRRKKNRRDKIPVIELHLSGHIFLDHDAEFFIEDEAELKQSWEENKEYLLSLIGQNLHELGLDCYISGIPCRIWPKDVCFVICLQSHKILRVSVPC